MNMETTNEPTESALREANCWFSVDRVPGDEPTTSAVASSSRQRRPRQQTSSPTRFGRRSQRHSARAEPDAQQAEALATYPALDFTV
jgi:hypothetical protein